MKIRHCLCVTIIFTIYSQLTYSASSEICNTILKNGVFNSIIKDSSKSAQENTFEWLQTATWEEFKKKQNAGLKIRLPIEDFPIEFEGQYTEDQFKKFVELRRQGKLRNFSADEFSHIVETSASATIANNWLSCMQINQDPKGLTCWGDMDDRIENGIVVFKARYFNDSELNTKVPEVRNPGGFTVAGGTVVGTNPLQPNASIPLGGVSVMIKRNNSDGIIVTLNSKKHGACTTVKFSPIEVNDRHPFKIETFSRTSAVNAHPDVTVNLPPGYKLISGGAQSNWHGNGNILTASYPNGNSWTARSKDHIHGDPSSITAWAIGLWDPNNQWDVIVQNNSQAFDGLIHGSVSVNLPVEYIRTGGGAEINYEEPGRLLTASHPIDSKGWIVADKDHEQPASGTLTAYVIGVKPKIGQLPQEQVHHHNSGQSVAHPTGSVSLDTNYVLTGGGARVVHCGFGNLLTASFPIDSRTWRVEAKDHDVPCPATLDMWAIGLKQPPGSILIEGGTPILEDKTIFSGAMNIVPGNLPAMRPIQSGDPTTPKTTYYISQPGDTFLSLALKFYNKPDWKIIKQENTNIISDWIIPVGTKVKIPNR